MSGAGVLGHASSKCSSHVPRLDPREVAAAVARADAPREAARVHHQEEVEAVDHEDVCQDPRVLAQGGEALEVGEGDHLCRNAVRAGWASERGGGR